MQITPDVKLYLECHITIRPYSLLDPEIKVIDELAQKYNFKRAKLYMKKTESLEPSQLDTFLTGHSKNFKNIMSRMTCLIEELTKAGIPVWRYKIEDTLCDSRIEDVYGLIDNERKV